MVMRSLIRAVYRFRDATLVDKKKEYFGNALQNLYRELERAENLVGPPNRPKFISIVSVDRRSRFCASHGRPNRLQHLKPQGRKW